MKEISLFPSPGLAGVAFFSLHSLPGLLLILFVLLFIALIAVFYLYGKTIQIKKLARTIQKGYDRTRLNEHISALDNDQLQQLLQDREHKPEEARSYPSGFSSSTVPASKLQRSSSAGRLLSTLLLIIGLALAAPVYAQDTAPTTNTLLSQPGIIILLILVMIPVLGGILLMGYRIARIARRFLRQRSVSEEAAFNQYLDTLNDQDAASALLARRKALAFRPRPNELSGNMPAEDAKGLLHNINSEEVMPFVPEKKRAVKRPPIDPALARLIIAYIVCAAGWLFIGTTIGEYIGIKFVAPDADHISWLSFGRLRPVHTNMVFWGWSSLAMLGLGNYIVPRVCNTALFSIRKGWYALLFINAAVIIGTLCLMAGINNAGGEYREYTWPVQALFAIGIILTLQNFLKTIARRTTKEIYISCWYIVSALIFVLVITLTAYLPWWQDGLGETIVQGYYMHQGVGMWFMFFTLGIVYYFLPQHLNRPIYSYSLGILAFWTQILFYTVIGTHHFVFSSIPWWLQTTAIIGSMGMVIPVTAGTTNFLMTIRSSWSSIASSYTLPFFLVGIIFYFTGSMQGTAEAFRSTNLIWHFTDFTVAHSHMTMYGIIAFFAWASIYVVLPRLTGKEAPQSTIGAHFWLALIGLLFYTIPLMYGSTMKGLLWTQGKPFIDSVVLMAPYWLWRAIGGSLMWLSHIVFCYNVYRMVVGSGVLAWRNGSALQLSVPASIDDQTAASLTQQPSIHGVL